MSVWGFQMALVCQKVVSQPQNTLRNGALAAKLGVFMLRCHFTAAKHPAKWGFGCEIGSFLCFAAVSQLQNTMQNGALAAKLAVFYASQPFRSCEMRVTMLRNGTRVPKVGFAATKLPTEWGFGCEIGNFHALELRSHFAAAKWGLLCCEVALVCQKWFCSKVLISQRLRNLADPCFSSSNDHNFFVSTPNCAPFEALDS